MTDGAPVISGALQIRDLRRNLDLAPGGSQFPEVVRRFLQMVHGAAVAMIPEKPEAAEEVAWSIFQALAIRWRGLGSRIFLGPWLVRSLEYAVARERSRLRLKAKAATPGGVIAQFSIKQVNGLPTKLGHAVILNGLLGESVDAKRLAKGLSKIDKPLRKLFARLAKDQTNSSLPTDLRAIELLKSIPAALSPEAEERILAKAREWTRKTPKTKLSRSILSAWNWRRVGLIFKRTAATAGLVVTTLACIGLTLRSLVNHGKINLYTIFIANTQKGLIEEFPALGKPARPWPTRTEEMGLPSKTAPKSSAELYRMTNIWLAKLTFTREQWQAVQPKYIEPAGNLPNGKMALRNSKASRSGVAGALGIDFHWSEAALEFADLKFDNVGVRFRGNGTYLNSLYGKKQSYKIDVNRIEKDAKIGKVTTLNLVNSIPDFSYIKDALAEKLFRDLGAIAPRTTYAYLTLDAPGAMDNRALGLYVVIEDIDGNFAKDRFGTKEVPIFKPVTYDLFDDCGRDWNAYKDIYDLKTKATPEQLARVVEFARFVSHTSDEEFARRLDEYLDFEEYAAFVVGHSLTASYDGYLSNGQNFYMYLDPRSNKFGFIPWDQDHGWGEFGYVGTFDKRETASIWNPSAYHNKFLERVMKVDAFKKVYRQKIEEALAGPFSEEKLFPQIDALAAAIRPAVAAESDFRLRRFNLAVKSAWLKGVRPDSKDMAQAEGPRSYPHQMKRFITTRIKSVRDQLDGKSQGSRLSGFGEP